MGTLIPGEALIYERVGGVVYAKYRDPLHNSIPRWIVGSTNSSASVNSFKEWRKMCALARKNEVLSNQLDKLMMLYYTIKNDNKGHSL